MAVNKVEYGGQTLIDLTADTVAEESLVAGATAHNAAGEQISGTFDPSKYAVLTDPNTFIGTQTARKELTIGTSAFMGAQFVSDCPNAATKEGIRAGYGFHNEGVTGACLYLDADRYFKTIDDIGSKYILPFGSRIYHIGWKESDTDTSRPQVLVDGSTWVEIPTYNEISRLLFQSPYPAVYDFSTNGYMDSSKYRYLLYDAQDGKNFAGIGVDYAGDIIFKTGISSVPCIFKMKSTGGFEVVADSGTVGHYREDSIACNSDYVIQTVGVSKAVYIRASQLNVQSSDASAWSPVYASAFSQQSSKRYKENIEDITEKEASKLLKLRPVKYDYINQRNGTGCYGLIAEEVDEVMSYPVVHDTDGNPDGIDYSKFVPHLIKMVQVQQNEINELKKSKEELKVRLEKLEELLNTDKEVE